MIEQQFVEYVVKQLVDNPDAVRVERVVDDKGILLKLIVAPEDLGRVIGKHGATAQSLRNLLRALGTKNDDHYNLKIIDVDKPEGEAQRETVQDATEPAREAETVASTTETVSDDKTVEKADAETVEKTDDLAAKRQKIRESLAELDDLDI